MLRAIIILAITWALPAIAQAPPPLLDELPDDPVTDPDQAPEPGAGDEFYEEPVAEPTPEPDPPPPNQEPRWNGGTTFLINSLAGVGVFCVAGFVPGGFCMAPAAAGLAQATLGDRYSERRGAFAPPVIVNYLVAGVGVAGLVGSYIFVLSNSFNEPGLAISLLVGTATFALVAPSMASAATYWLLSEAKLPGDTGSGQPGAFTPAHREVKKIGAHFRAVPVLAMRY